MRCLIGWLKYMQWRVIGLSIATMLSLFRPPSALNLCKLGIFSSCGFCCRLLTFLGLTFFKKSSRNTIRVSNGLDTDMDRRSVGPDLEPTRLQWLKSRLAWKELKRQSTQPLILLINLHVQYTGVYPLKCLTSNYDHRLSFLMNHRTIFFS